MEFSAKQIADLLKGTVEGDENVMVSDITKIEQGRKGSLSFLANPKYSKYIYTTESSIVLVNNDFKLESEISPTLIRVENAYESFAMLLQFVVDFAESGNRKQGIDSLAYVHETAKIGNDVYIAPFVYIGKNTEIGDGVQLYPHVYLSDNVKVANNTILAAGVKVYHNCVIGSKCVIHSGVVIGSDGFGFAPNSENEYRKIPQIGNVVIEDNVEIGANTTIDRATMGSTFIRKGVKLDNLIQIGHNADIGENTVMAAQVGVSGSTVIGRDCMFGGQVGVIGHAHIANKVKVGAQSGIANDITQEGISIQGSPAILAREQFKLVIHYQRLPQMDKRITELEKQIIELQKKLSEK